MGEDDKAILHALNFTADNRDYWNVNFNVSKNNWREDIPLLFTGTDQGWENTINKV